MGQILLSPLLVMSLLLGSARADEKPPLFNTDGYRQEHYRSPTPEQAPGAVTVDTAALRQLLERQPEAVLIDVFRRTWRFGQFFEDQPHSNLPGSVWLANTGDGTLEPGWEAYFTRNLERLSQGRKDAAIVFYCRSDCWLGWNATRRAQAMGYTQLYWYRDGIDGWQQAGLPLHEATPEPFPAP
ncbi:PQQ-dependent catabolism-associated CXXCW motif protein [Stutzerimonas kirkiae]|uniref:Sulfurtransferase n=1 Tax=Stutzerimonas kirkiae TaxID=2211392 RepID=A0A4Q9RDN0_9GAMM|nr:PQQ-dependent catabolism-associated CXXCW motif protein [Stutzerimonas kirkiae]TBU99816.1 sulfurtransferase [Stutzerimonas kirkiae]TBV05252.1 sulfurtransferase [Stutzerimonas kirkiae]TBV11686.1 sulfurtransferase [Stutzerimonas kirkiae]TBV15386.1 sulfurtransferase [Stutzerimonas kirkiae]